MTRIGKAYAVIFDSYCSRVLQAVLKDSSDFDTAIIIGKKTGRKVGFNLLYQRQVSPKSSISNGFQTLMLRPYPDLTTF
mgnify:CR=1 FL=1